MKDVHVKIENPSWETRHIFGKYIDLPCENKGDVITFEIPYWMPTMPYQEIVIQYYVEVKLKE